MKYGLINSPINSTHATFVTERYFRRINFQVQIIYTFFFFLKFREYDLGDGKVSFPVNLTLQGDVTVVVYHGRSTLGGKVQGKMTSMRVFMLQFHTGFIKTSAHKLKYSRYAYSK